MFPGLQDSFGASYSPPPSTALYYQYVSHSSVEGGLGGKGGGRGSLRPVATISPRIDKHGCHDFYFSLLDKLIIRNETFIIIE